MSRDIFVPRSSQEVPGLNLSLMLGLKDKVLQKGEIGIEIEVEGKNLPGVSQAAPPAPWVYKPDHSLRGPECGEYVLSSAIDFSEVPSALKKLWTQFNSVKTKFNDSNRTSIHIHLNCQRWHLNRLAAFSAIYLILEDVLTEWCGDHRVGNLFCQRARDAEAIVTWLKKFICMDGMSELPDGLHYSGMNVHALPKFGSVEIRTLRGVYDQKVIQSWINIMERLYALSAQFSEPTEICDWFSAEGPTSFFERILGPVGKVVRQGVNMSSDEIADSMYAGVRRAQDICFCRDWSLFKTLDVSDNPFGLSKKKLVEKAMAASGYADVGTEDIVTMAAGMMPLNEWGEPEYDDVPVHAPSTPQPISNQWTQYMASFGSGLPNPFNH